MEQIYKKARAKINLNMMVLDKRKDNYHNIKSIFQKINLYDEIYLTKTKNNDFCLKTNVEELNNENNIIYKAYVMLKRKYPNITGVQVALKKRIPMQAGMAGGSTDCASFILAMNQLFDLQLSKQEIEEVGKSLGADVISCFYNKAILVEGIGDIVTPIDTNFKYYIIIVKPQFACNTSIMYHKLDEMNKRQVVVDTSNKIKQALESNDIEMLGNNLYNAFEEVVEEKELVEKIKEDLKRNGAIGSLMTGSGSCIYGIFKNKETAKLANRVLKSKYQTFLCTSYQSQKEVLI